MATQGAVQIEVTINGKSITIKKDHVMSLQVTRVIGDAADEFTLEAFDETAWQLENALMGSEYAPISVRYSATNDLKKSIVFAGTCHNYQVSFVGRATMLSITGILSVSTGDSTIFTFGTQAIEWVGGLEDRAPKDSDQHDYYVDGKSIEEMSEWVTNEDVCAILDFPAYANDDGTISYRDTPEVYYNPSRIFKRIIKKYNGEIGPYKADTDMDPMSADEIAMVGQDLNWTLRDYGAGTFNIGQVDESRWIAGLRTTQEADETAANYIVNVLCKNAMSADNIITKDASSITYGDVNTEVAGFRYYIKNGAHCFTKLNYGTGVVPDDTVTITYGMDNSNIISFSMMKIGAIAMTGGTTADSSSMDEFTGDQITSDMENMGGTVDRKSVTSSNNKYANWYFGFTRAVKVTSSSSQSGLEAELSSTWEDLQRMVYTAELTVWADCSGKYAPGGWVNVVIIGAGGVRHYASGTYMITKIVDNISSDGYTQTMSLLKNAHKKSNSDKVTEATTLAMHDASGNIITSLTP